MSDRITVIESGRYREEQTRLMADPIIQAMAAELPAPSRFPDENLDGHDFMVGALEEYRRRAAGACNHESIGGPARAIRAIVLATRAADDARAERLEAEYRDGADR